MAQIIGGVHRGHAAGDTNIEKAASQLVSDTKYEVKRLLGSDVVSKMAAAALMKAYIQQLNKSESGPVKALAQKKLTGGSMKEDFNIDALASSSVANALFKVFVEGVEKEEYVLGEEYLEELMKRNEKGESLYSVKVYYKNGTTYVRWSSREDMSKLRSNPNVESIEMVDYAPPEGQGGGSSRKDYDRDGKVESGAKEHAGAVHNAIQRKRGGIPDGKDTSSVREDVDFFEEGKKKDQKFDVMPKDEDNSKIVKLFPETTKVNEEVITTQQKFMRMISEKAESEKQQKLFGLALSVKRGETPRSEVSVEVLKIVDTMSEKKIRDFAKTKHEGLPVHKEEIACDSSEPQRDRRGDYAKLNLLKNKLRSGLGVKNPIVMVSSEEEVKEDLQSSVKGALEKGADFMKTNPIGKAASAVLAPVGTGRGTGRGTVTGAEQKQKIQRNVAKEEVEMVDEAAKRIKGKLQSGTRTFSGDGYLGRGFEEKKDPKKMKKIFPGPKGDEESDGGDHPSLSASERNPNLR